MDAIHVQRLDQLPTRARLALACTCIEHVMDLYRWGIYAYPMDKAHADLRRLATEDDGIKEALKLGWDLARDGRADDHYFEAIVDFVCEYPPGLDPEDWDELTAAAWVMSACRHMLNTQTDATPKSVSTATDCCWYAVYDAVKAIPEIMRAGDVQATALGFCRPEQEWQVTVLDRVEQLGDQSFRRDMFADLLAVALPWRGLLPQYRAVHGK